MTLYKLLMFVNHLLVCNITRIHTSSFVLSVTSDEIDRPVEKLIFILYWLVFKLHKCAGTSHD